MFYCIRWPRCLTSPLLMGAIVVAGCSSQTTVDPKSAGGGGDLKKFAFEPDTRQPVTIDSATNAIAQPASASAAQGSSGKFVCPGQLEPQSQPRSVPGRMPQSMPRPVPGQMPRSVPGGSLAEMMLAEAPPQRRLPAHSQPIEPDVAVDVPIQMPETIPLEGGMPCVLAGLGRPIAAFSTAWPANLNVPPPFKYDDTGRTRKPRRLKRGEKPELDDSGVPKTYIPLKEQAGAGFPVFDLQQRKKVGTFNWRAPIEKNPALSPDGKYMVGQVDYDGRFMRLEFDIQQPPSPNSLGIFSSNEKDVEGWIELPGTILWIGFVSDTVVAVYCSDPSQSVQFWDVAANKKRGELAVADVFASDFSQQLYLGAVSANGRYLAIGTMAGVHVIDARAYTPLAFYPHSQNTRDTHYYGLDFSRDGEKLYLSLAQGGRLSLTRFQLSSGTMDLALDTFVHGPIFEGPLPNTVTTGNRPAGRSLDVFDGPSDIVELAAGNVLQQLPYNVIRDFGNGNLLTVLSDQQVPATARRPQSVTLDPTEEHVRVVGLRQAISQSDLEPASLSAFRLVEQRPPSPPLDRSTIQQHPLEKPQQTVAPALSVTPPQTVIADKDVVTPTYPTWPVAFGKDEVACVFYRELHSPDHVEMWGFHANRQTGKPLDVPVLLFPWIAPMGEKFHPGTGPRGAISPDGSMLAIFDVYFNGRMDVFDHQGKHLHSVTIDDSPTLYQKVAWLAPDRMVILRDKKVLAINPIEGRAIYEIEGVGTVADLNSDREWILVAGQDGLMAIDGATGTSLRYFQPSEDGVVVQARVSPDGQHIAALYERGFESIKTRANVPPNPANDYGHGGLEQTELEFGLAIWDTQTGERMIEDLGQRYVSIQIPEYWLHWNNNDCILYGVSGEGLGMYDVASRAIVCGYGYKTGNMRSSGDGRIWMGGTSSGELPGHGEVFGSSSPYHEVFFEHLSLQPTTLLASDLQVITPHLTGVKVVADVYDEPINEQFAKAIAEVATSSGYSLKSGGFTATLTAALSEDTEGLKFDNSTMGVPLATFRYTFTFPDGSAMEKVARSTDRGFSADASQYKLDKRSDLKLKDGQMAGTLYYEFDFGNKDPRRAMADEFFLDLVPQVNTFVNIPSESFLYTDGKYIPFPLSGTIGGRPNELHRVPTSIEWRGK